MRLFLTSVFQFFFQSRRDRDSGPLGIGLIVHADALAQKRIPLDDFIPVDRHKQHLLLADQHHALFGPGDAGIEQVAVEHDGVRFQKRHDDRFIFRAHCLVDGGGVGKVQIDHILYAVFQLSAHTEIQADALSIFIVFDIADKSQVAVGHLGGVFGLHDPVVDPEHFDADLDFFLGRAERVDHLADGLVELFRRRSAF